MSAWIRGFFDQPTIVVHKTKKFLISFVSKVSAFHAKELPEFCVTEVITVFKKLSSIYFIINSSYVTFKWSLN
jgi:hypothetical protein